MGGLSGLSGLTGLSGVAGGRRQLAYYEKVKATVGASLLMYLRLIETGGTNAADASGNNNVGTYVGPTLAAIAGPVTGEASPSFTANDYAKFYNSAFSAAFNGREGSFGAWVKVSAAGIWTDTKNHCVFHVSRGDSRNGIAIYTGGSGQTTFEYIANAVYKNMNINMSGTGWQFIVMNWSDSGDIIQMFVNGVSQGATTGIGTWETGALYQDQCLVGIFDYNNLNLPWEGAIGDAFIATRPLTQAEITSLNFL